jgi:hypothetical protein
VGATALAAAALAGAVRADPLDPCRPLVAAARRADPALLARVKTEPGVLFNGLVHPLPDAHPSPAVLARAADAFADDPGSIVATQAFGGGVWRAVRIEGSADCEIDHFFRYTGPGVAAPMADVAAYGGLCFDSSREMARVDGRLALVETDAMDTPDLGVEVEVTPWNDGWGPTCRAAVRLAERFRVSERFCQGEPACGDAERLAASLAQAFVRSRYGRDPAPLAAVSPVDPAIAGKLAPALEALSKDMNAALPTFGATPRTQYPQYSTFVGVPVRLDDRPFLARVGQGGVGWRSLGDYLVAYYAPDGDGLKPVASYVVKREATGLKSADLSIPQPAVNTR